MQPLLQIVNAAKQYQQGSQSITAFTGINLNIQAGEIVSVIGPSGCGKSSLLRALAGLEKLTTGEMILGDVPVHAVDDRVGIVFQEPRLLPWLTVRDNVALPRRLSKNAHLRLGRSAIDDMLIRVDLDGFATAYPRQISGGMAQRAALARALLRRPEVLLFDEPFAALDALTRVRLQSWVRDLLKERRTTALFVTHDISEALAVGDRIALFTPHPGTLFRVYDVPSEPDTTLLRDRVLEDLKSMGTVGEENVS